MSRLFAFDMDGTLLPGTTGLLELAKTLGTVEELKALEVRYTAGSLNTLGFTKEISRLWGRIPDATAHAAFQSAPKISGIPEVLSIIREAGDISCVVTMSQDVFANQFLELGFDHVFATPYPPHNDDDFSLVLTPEHKISLLQELAATLGLDFDQTVAFGDSISDVELFSKINHPVSVNGDHHVAEYAVFSYRGGSILEAFLASRHLWDSL